jgi:hypothetical protein
LTNESRSASNLRKDLEMTKRDEEKEAAQDKERLHKEALAFKDKAKQAIKDHDEEVKLGAFPAPKK